MRLDRGRRLLGCLVPLVGLLEIWRRGRGNPLPRAMCGLGGNTAVVWAEGSRGGAWALGGGVVRVHPLQMQ